MIQARLRVSRSIRWCWIGSVAYAALGAAVMAVAADTAALQHAHAWGRFAKGSWRQVRVVTETFDERGALTNTTITDNKTTVEEVTPVKVTLRVEVTVEVAGQKFPSQPQIVKQGYAGENAGQTVSIKPLKQETLIVDGQAIACETQQIEIVGGANKEISLISYAARSTPSILKRVSTTSDTATSKTTQEAVSEVYALDMPFKVLDEIKSAYSVRQEQKNDRGTTTTWSVHVPDVPGEIVAQSSKKLDSQNRLTRRSTLEVVAYGFGDEDIIRGRGRVRRHKRGR